MNQSNSLISTFRENRNKKTLKENTHGCPLVSHENGRISHVAAESVGDAALLGCAAEGSLANADASHDEHELDGGALERVGLFRHFSRLASTRAVRGRLVEGPRRGNE